MQMGCTALAACPCGFDSGELFVGQGMSGPDPCHFPAYCKEGSHLVTVNLIDQPSRCPEGHKTEPVPYNDNSLIDKLGVTVVADWWLDDETHLELTDGTYLCPACQQYTLTFRKGNTMWD